MTGIKHLHYKAHEILWQSSGEPMPKSFQVKYCNFLHNEVYSKMANSLWATATRQCTEPTGWLLYFMNQGGHFLRIIYFNWYNGVCCQGYQPTIAISRLFDSISPTKPWIIFHAQGYSGTSCDAEYIHEKKNLKKSVVGPINWGKWANFSEFCYFYPGFHGNHEHCSSLLISRLVKFF